MENLIEIKGLVKEYGTVMALKGINLNFEKGAIIGLLGPNGSGKTTLIKIITNLIMNYHGEVLIDGKTPGIDSKGIISYLPDRNFIADKWTIKYTVEYYKDFFKDFDDQKAYTLLTNMGIDLKKTFKSLSKGMKEKVQLVLVLSRKAKIYIFDEPIAGVDPAARDLIFELILRHRTPDSTIIISTHLVSEVESILDDVILLKEGTVLFNGTKEELKEKYEQDSINDIFREVYRHAPIA